MPNKEERGVAYRRILDTIEKEIRSQQSECVSVLKALDDEGKLAGWCDYYPQQNVYKGYCKIRRCRFCINTHTLMEYAAHSDSALSLKASLSRGGHFDVATDGGGMIAVSEDIKNAVVGHFWTQYKALTG